MLLLKAVTYVINVTLKIPHQYCCDHCDQNPMKTATDFENCQFASRKIKV